MQNFSRLAATTLRGSLFALAIALTACNSSGTGSANSNAGTSAAVSNTSASSNVAANRSAVVSWSAP